jgi:hypothetical protein
MRPADSRPFNAEPTRRRAARGDGHDGHSRRRRGHERLAWCRCVVCPNALASARPCVGLQKQVLGADCIAEYSTPACRVTVAGSPAAPAGASGSRVSGCAEPELASVAGASEQQQAPQSSSGAGAGAWSPSLLALIITHCSPSITAHSSPSPLALLIHPLLSPLTALTPCRTILAAPLNPAAHLSAPFQQSRSTTPLAH